jgi:hypothetical protein
LKQYMEKSKVAIIVTTIDVTKQQGKKWKLVNPTNIIEYFGSCIPYKKSDSQPQHFFTNLVFFITKKCVPLSMCNSPCFQHFVLQCDSKVNFPSQRSLVQEHIPLMCQRLWKNMFCHH